MSDDVRCGSCGGKVGTVPHYIQVCADCGLQVFEGVPLATPGGAAPCASCGKPIAAGESHICGCTVEGGSSGIEVGRAAPPEPAAPDVAALVEELRRLAGHDCEQADPSSGIHACLTADISTIEHWCLPCVLDRAASALAASRDTEADDVNPQGWSGKKQFPNRTWREHYALLAAAVNAAPDTCDEGCDSHGHSEACGQRGAAWPAEEITRLAASRGDQRVREVLLRFVEWVEQHEVTTQQECFALEPGVVDRFLSGGGA